jgi:hypothetical protein
MLEQFQTWGIDHSPAVLPDVFKDPLTCVDDLYYVTRRKDSIINEYLNAPEDGTWANVGVKLRWHPQLLAEARVLEKKLLDVPSMQSVPKVSLPLERVSAVANAHHACSPHVSSSLRCTFEEQVSA